MAGASGSPCSQPSPALRDATASPGRVPTGSSSGAVSWRPATKHARDMLSYALRPSRETRTVSSQSSSAVRTWAAKSVPARDRRANQYGRGAPAKTGAHRLAKERETRRRSTSPVAMPLTRPSGLRSAVKRTRARAGATSVGTRAFASCVAAKGHVDQQNLQVRVVAGGELGRRSWRAGDTSPALTPAQACSRLRSNNASASCVAALTPLRGVTPSSLLTCGPVAALERRNNFHAHEAGAPCHASVESRRRLSAVTEGTADRMKGGTSRIVGTGHRSSLFRQMTASRAGPRCFGDAAH